MIRILQYKDRKASCLEYSKGLNKALYRGAYQNKLEKAAAFKRLGIDIDKIAEGTGVSREEIEKL